MTVSGSIKLIYRANGLARYKAMTSSLENPEPEYNHLEITSSRQFPAWLAQQGISLAFSTYQTNRLFGVGSREAGRLKVHERLFDKLATTCTFTRGDSPMDTNLTQCLKVGLVACGLMLPVAMATRNAAGIAPTSNAAPATVPAPPVPKLNWRPCTEPTQIYPYSDLPLHRVTST